jgi:hypothetical protein
MKPLVGFIKQSTQQGRKEEQRKDPNQSQKHKNPKWVTNGQRNKLCSKTPTNCNKHIKEGK